jgi:hypothetical protein
MHNRVGCGVAESFGSVGHMVDDGEKQGEEEDKVGHVYYQNCMWNGCGGVSNLFGHVHGLR